MGLQEHELKQERYRITLQLIANNLARCKVSEASSPASLASLASPPQPGLSIEATRAGVECSFHGEINTFLRRLRLMVTASWGSQGRLGPEWTPIILAVNYIANSVCHHRDQLVVQLRTLRNVLPKC